MKRFRYFLILALAVAVWMTNVACKHQSTDSTAQAASAQNPAQNGAQGQAEAPQAAQVENQTRTIPEGTALRVRLLDPIGSATDTGGQAFRATLDEPIVVDNVVAVPRDANVTGRVLVARASGHLQTPAELVVTLTSLEAGGKAYEVVTSDVSWRGRSHKKRNAELIGGGAGFGALIGALVGHGKGAAIGAGIGAGGGTATAYATGRKELSIPAETRLSFVLRRPVTL